MIPDRQIQEARTRRPLSAVIGGDVKLIHRHGEWMGLCPFHKERTPSFTVVDGKGFYHCFGCGAHGDAISWRMEFHNESFREAVETLSGESLPAGEVREPALRIAEQQMHSAGYSAKARALWDEAVQIAGTPGDGYFRGRGITIPLPPSLRYHARCVRGSGEHRRLLPAVVCNVQDLEGRTVAVHRIYLEPSSFTGIPRKIGSAPDKALLGSPGTGSIRLAEAAPSMGRAEGVETSLAVMQATHVPIWSAIHAGHMPKMAISSGSRSDLHLRRSRSRFVASWTALWQAAGRAFRETRGESGHCRGTARARRLARRDQGRFQRHAAGGGMIIVRVELHHATEPGKITELARLRICNQRRGSLLTAMLPTQPSTNI